VTIEATTIQIGQGRPPLLATTDTSLGSIDLLLCRTGRQLHAIPIEHVCEIMRALPIEAVAGVPVFILGVCLIRGRPTPVVDAGLLIGKDPTTSERLVSLKIGDRRIALAVDAVLGLRRFDGDAFQQLPPLLRDIAGEAVSAIGAKDDELMFMLRAARIVPDNLFDDLEREGADA
jgi:purine-binding chemotaxis protein CheW